MSQTPLRAVVFDWRGTLVTTLDERQWVTRALRMAAGEADEASVHDVLAALRPIQPRLDDPATDADAELHRRAWMAAFADAGLDEPLAQALYAVESDTSLNPFATDVAPTLTALRQRGVRVGVLSDIHVDVRPAFAAAGLGGLVDSFTLSFEHGLVKPDPALYAAALAGLGTTAEGALMVGDRSVPDGGAVEAGLSALLLPPLRAVTEQRLHRVLQLCPPHAPA